MSDPVPDAARPDASTDGGQSRRYATMVVASLSLIVLSCVAFLVPVPYVTMRPGPAFDTLGDFQGQPMFTFGKDAATYPTNGSLDFTTVSVTRAESKVSLAEALGAFFAGDTAVVPKSFIYPDDETGKESRAEGQAQLTSSKDSSRVAALRAAGYTVPETPAVDTVLADGASKGRLEKGDLLRSVDGDTMSSAQDVVDAIGKVDPGDAVQIGLTRDGQDRTVEIVTRPDADQPDVPRIGVGLTTKYTYPVDITNNVGEQVGGPSAGTMFALAIYDRLTPGSLTGGRRVAGTGEIAPDGTVGPIGGVRQKMAGAAADDASIFLVPAANCAEAADGDDQGLQLIKISTLKGAISALDKIADDPKATVPTCR